MLSLSSFLQETSQLQFNIFNRVGHQNKDLFWESDHFLGKHAARNHAKMCKPTCNEEATSCNFLQNRVRTRSSTCFWRAEDPMIDIKTHDATTLQTRKDSALEEVAKHWEQIAPMKRKRRKKTTTTAFSWTSSYGAPAQKNKKMESDSTWGRARIGLEDQNRDDAWVVFKKANTKILKSFPRKKEIFITSFSDAWNDYHFAEDAVLMKGGTEYPFLHSINDAAVDYPKDFKAILPLLPRGGSLEDKIKAADKSGIFIYKPTINDSPPKFSPGPISPKIGEGGGDVKVNPNTVSPDDIEHILAPIRNPTAEIAKDMSRPQSNPELQFRYTTLYPQSHHPALALAGPLVMQSYLAKSRLNDWYEYTKAVKNSATAITTGGKKNNVGPFRDTDGLAGKKLINEKLYADAFPFADPKGRPYASEMPGGLNYNPTMPRHVEVLYPAPVTWG